MKLFVVAAVLGVCSAGRLDNAYLPPRGNAGSGAGSFGGSGNFGASAHSQGAGFGGQSSGFGGQSSGFGGQYSGNAGNAYSGGGQQQYKSNPADTNAQILRYNSDVKSDSFSYDFETSNGIRADASGVATNGVQSQGSFGYKGDDGQDYSITYTADENGYQPRGAHLPTPPPIPAEILKALEQNARDEAAGIVDDGQYHGEGAGHGGAGGYSGNQGGFSGNQGGYGGNQGGYGGNQGGNQGGHGGNQGNFGGAPSRQYLTPSSGPAKGSGNFNPQSGYQY